MVTYSYFRTLAPGETVTITDYFQPGRITSLLIKQQSFSLDVGFKLTVGSLKITSDFVRFNVNGFKSPLSIKLSDKTKFLLTIKSYSTVSRNVSVIISEEGGY